MWGKKAKLSWLYPYNLNYEEVDGNERFHVYPYFAMYSSIIKYRNIDELHYRNDFLRGIEKTRMGIERMLHHFFVLFLFKIDFFLYFSIVFFYSFWTFTNIFNRSHKLNERKIDFFHICKLQKKSIFHPRYSFSYTALCTLFVASEKSTSKFGSRLKKSERDFFFFISENYT